MKKLGLLILLSIILTSYNANSQDSKSKDDNTQDSKSHNGKSQNKLKRFEIKSGIVAYETAISGEFLGSTISGSGQETVYFKDWGAVELREEKSSQTTTTQLSGTKTVETEEKHIIEKLDNGKWFIANCDLEEIIEQRSFPIDLITAYHPEADAGDVGKDITENLLGGKITGQETYKGYLCDVWETEVTKSWVYKNLTLKIESNVVGIITTKKATKIQFHNDNIPNKHFKLPDYPVTKAVNMFSPEGIKMLHNGNVDLNKISFEEWKKMALTETEDTEMKNKSEEELKEMYEMIMGMLKNNEEN